MARHLGVRYIYETVPSQVEQDRLLTINPEDLATIPQAPSNDVEAAVVSLDSAPIPAVISRIGANTALGRSLRRLADKLADSAILRAIQPSKGAFKVAGGECTQIGLFVRLIATIKI
jgi:hypothetical protein